MVELSCSQANDDRQTDIMITIPLVLPRGKNPLTRPKQVVESYLKHLCNRHNLPQTIVYLITSLGAGTIIYDYQTVRYVISDVDVYSAPCRYLMITKKLLIVS